MTYKVDCVLFSGRLAEDARALEDLMNSRNSDDGEVAQVDLAEIIHESNGLLLIWTIREPAAQAIQLKDVEKKRKSA